MFFDLETTGTSVTHDRIVEISMLRLDPGADEPREWTVRLNPGMHIPEEATAVHHRMSPAARGLPILHPRLHRLSPAVT